MSSEKGRFGEKKKSHSIFSFEFNIVPFSVILVRKWSGEAKAFGSSACEVDVPSKQRSETSSENARGTKTELTFTFPFSCQLN